MTAAAVVLGLSIAAPLLLLSHAGDSTTVTLPPTLPTAGAIVLVLTAAGLLWRFIGRPIYRAVKFVRERLEENSALVEQVRELVQYIGLFGYDVEARLDRIEKHLGLGYYRRDTDKTPSAGASPAGAPPSLLARLKTQQAIRDLGAEDPPLGTSWS